MAELHTCLGECLDMIIRAHLRGEKRDEIAAKVDAYWKDQLEDLDFDEIESERDLSYELMDWWDQNPINYKPERPIYNEYMELEVMPNHTVHVMIQKMQKAGWDVISLNYENNRPKNLVFATNQKQ